MIIVSTLILLIFNITSVLAISDQKIQVSEEWTYTDGTVFYNETSIETIQFLTENGVIPTSVVNTNRRTENNMLFHKVLLSPELNMSIDINMVEDLDRIYVTQIGGFPLFSASTVTGYANMTVTTDNGTLYTVIDYIDLVNQTVIPSLGGDLTSALLTGSSEQIKLSRVVTFENDDYQFQFERMGIISTDQSISDSSVNFTLTWLETNIYARFGQITGSHASFLMERTQFGTTYTINSYGWTKNFNGAEKVPQAQLYQYTSQSKLPVLVRQTEPSTVQGLELNSLGLDQEGEIPTKIVEYRLVLDDVQITESDVSSISQVESSITDSESSNSNETRFSLYFIPFLLVPIMRKFINK